MFTIVTLVSASVVPRLLYLWAVWGPRGGGSLVVVISLFRTGALAVGLGVAGWLTSLLVAAHAHPAGVAAVDPAVLYTADGSFAAAVALNNLLLCSATFAIAWLLARRGEPSGCVLCALAAAVLVGAWAVRAGLDAGAIGVGADIGALALATAPHTAPELALIILAPVAAACGHRPRPAWLAACGAGLVACAVVEAVL